jgi:hypothetical protein
MDYSQTPSFIEITTHALLAGGVVGLLFSLFANLNRRMQGKYRRRGVFD